MTSRLTLPQVADEPGYTSCMADKPTIPDGTPGLMITYDLQGNEISRKISLGAETEGLVYIVQAMPDSPVKIGFTTRPDVGERVAGLQTGNPHPLRVLTTVKARLRDERAIHKALAPERLTGEWFEWSARTMMFVERLLLNGLEDAVEAIAQMQAPVVPKGWDMLCIAESWIHATFSLRRTDIVSKARKAGTGPEFHTVTKSGRPVRYYRLSDLKLWFVENKVPHRVRADYFASTVYRVVHTDEPG